MEDNDESTILDKVEEEYLIEKGDRLIFDPDGSEAVELAYKVKLLNILKSEGDEFHDIADEGWEMEGITLVRIHNEIMEEISDIEDNVAEVEREREDPDQKQLNEALEDLTSIQTSDSVLLFYSLSHEVIRGLSGDLIFQNMVGDEKFEEDAKRYARNMDAIDQENLLYYMGIIDEGQKGEIANVRKTRNKLIHDIRKRQYLDGIENVESMIKRAMKIIDDLHEEAHGRSLLD